jgi:hypothetical protein
MSGVPVSAKERTILRRNLLRWAVLPLVPYAGEATTPVRVYVYAQRSTPARSWLPVFCGEAAVAALKEGRFFAMLLPPGRYTFSVENGVPRSIEVKPGTDVYLRLDWSHQIGRPPIPALSGVRPDKARQEMRFLSYIESKRINSESVSQQDPRKPEGQQLKRRSVQ